MHVYWPSLWRWRDEEEEEGDEEGGGEKRGYTVRTWWRNSHCNPFSTLLNSFHLFMSFTSFCMRSVYKSVKATFCTSKINLVKIWFLSLMRAFLKIKVWHWQDVTAPSPTCLERVSVLQPWTFLHHQYKSQLLSEGVAEGHVLKLSRSAYRSEFQFNSIPYNEDRAASRPGQVRCALGTGIVDVLLQTRRELQRLCLNWMTSVIVWWFLLMCF